MNLEELPAYPEHKLLSPYALSLPMHFIKFGNPICTFLGLSPVDYNGTTSE